MKKWFKYGSIAVVIILTVLYFAAPVEKFDGRYQIGSEIGIEAPDSTVFRYMGISDNAAKWSVYVDHITVLSGRDGEQGCVRRCFQQKDEKGIVWDETLLKVEAQKSRLINIYNAKGFPMYTEGLLTEQKFRQEGSMTYLSLLLYLPKNASLWERIKFHAGSYTVHKIFSGNIANIKQAIEQN